MVRTLAIIFDCDGVLVDSEKLSCGALNTVFEKYYGIDIGTEYEPIIGKALKDSLTYYLEKYDLSKDKLPLLIKSKEEAYQDAAKGKLKSFPCADFFLQEAMGNGIKLGVASSGSLEKIAFSLQEVGYTNYFQAIASSEEVPYGKPEPDVFLLAAKRLKVKPEHCTVIEDSINGARAAKAAGMKVYGFPGAFSASDFEAIGVGFLPEGYRSLYKIFFGEYPKCPSIT